MPPAKNPLEDLRQAHEILKKVGIPHALIGGWAAIAWGVVRATSDLDMLVLIDHARRSRIAQAFEGVGYHLEWRKGGLDDPITELLRMTPTDRSRERAKIDFILASKGFDLDTLSRAVTISIGAWTMPVLRPEDLIATKLSAGGGVDFQDAKSLLEIHAKTLDEELLKSSCNRLKVMHRLQHLQQADW